MTNVTKVLRDMHDRFPAGTSVSLFKRKMRDGSWATDGAAVTSATVQADGTLTFASVPDDAGGYIAVATVNSKQVVVQTGAGAISWASRH